MLKILFLLAVIVFASPAFADPVRIVALGDSLMAGYGLNAATESYPAQLQAALAKDGFDVRIDNAGISGDTTQGGLQRLAKAIAGTPKPDLVLVALGANDMLRNVDPKVTEANLRSILRTLQEANIKTLLIGMKAGYWIDRSFASRFEAVYPRMADEFDVELYPFFLEGVVLKPDLNLSDGFHPNAKGVALMVEQTKEIVEDMLED